MQMWKIEFCSTFLTEVGIIKKEMENFVDEN